MGVEGEKKAINNENKSIIDFFDLHDGAHLLLDDGEISLFLQFRFQKVYVLLCLVLPFLRSQHELVFIL